MLVSLDEAPRFDQFMQPFGQALTIVAAHSQLADELLISRHAVRFALDVFEDGLVVHHVRSDLEARQNNLSPKMKITGSFGRVILVCRKPRTSAAQFGSFAAILRVFSSAVAQRDSYSRLLP